MKTFLSVKHHDRGSNNISGPCAYKHMYIDILCACAAYEMSICLRDSRASRQNRRENRVVTAADSRDRRVFGGPLQNDQPAQ